MRFFCVLALVIASAGSLAGELPRVSNGALHIGPSIKIAPPNSAAPWQYADTRRIGKVTQRTYQAVVSDEWILYAMPLEMERSGTAEAMAQLKAATARVAEELRGRGAKVLPLEAGMPLAPNEMVPAKCAFTKGDILGTIAFVMFPKPEPFLLFTYCRSASQALNFQKFVMFEVTIVQPTAPDEPKL